jgi:1,4-dihydroxy-2-naphthoate octaprenyltransferase
MNVKNLVLAFRPKTLTAAVVPVVAATALAKAQGHQIHFWILIFALLAALCIQIGTNLVNDAMDFKKGADTTERIGPKRITVSGSASFKKVMWMGTLFFLAAIAFGVPLVMHGGPPIVWIGLVSVLCGYAYTSGPYPLAYKGLGDLFVIIFFGIISVVGMFYLYTGLWSFEAWMLGLQIGFLATVLIAINNLRDVDTDVKANKKTLAVRMGKAFARWEIALLITMTFIMNIYWMQKSWMSAGLLPLVIMPLGFVVIKNIFQNEPSPKYNKFLAQSAALHLLFGVLISLGFWFS